MTSLSGANLNNGVAVGPQGEGKDSPSTFPKYPVYKDSGVEWLGEVPEHWAIFSLKRSVDGCTNGLWGDEPDGENDLAVIRVADFDRATCSVGLDKLTYRSITQKERASRLLQSGDLLIEKSGGGEKTLVGCVVLFEHEFEAITSNFVARMRPLHGFDSGFLCYSFDSLYQGKVNFPAIKQTTGIQNLDSESYLQERFCFPTLAEQTQIARFLDHEIVRIDALIEEQQRLIELLKEKRQAVISHAVTKGLDLTVPMKDSGVEWLGEVPAHWVVMQLSRALDKVDQGWSPNASNEPAAPDEWGVIKISAIKKGIFFGSENKALLENTRPELAFEIKDGDVLITRANTPDLVGDACVVRNDSGSRLMLSDLVYRLRLAPGIDAGFICYFLLGHLGRAQIKSDARGSSMSMAKISQGHIKAWLLALPSYSEQVEISKFISDEISKHDELIRVATESHTLLAERRSALISAVVTGKIDVRGWQPPVSTQAPESAVAEAD